MIVGTIKIVFVEGAANDYAAYAGPTEWDDSKVASSGKKLREEEAGDILNLAWDLNLPLGIAVPKLRDMKYRE